MAYTDNIIPTMTSNTAPSGVVTSSSDVNGDWSNHRAFDHLSTGDIFCWISGTGETGYLQYQFPVARAVTCYAITTRSFYGPAMAPKTWTFQGSNDGSTWDTLDAQTDITDWATTLGARKVFTLSNTTEYAYFRLDILGSNTEGYVGVGELEMMETVRSGRWFRRRGRNGQPDRVMRMKG